MSYQVYLFDFDYTLADSSRGITLCFRHVLERNGYAGVTDEAIRRTIGKTLEESFSILTGVTDPDRLAAFKAEYRREADVYMTPNTRLFPETLRVLRTLKERGAKIGIISTKYRFRIHDTMDQHPNTASASMTPWTSTCLRISWTSWWAAKTSPAPSPTPKDCSTPSGNWA